jgi:putative transposase
LRKSPPRSDEIVIKQAIANVVKDRATYGRRRVWARLRLDGHDRVNHKRVYRVMRDEGWLLCRHGENPVDTKKHEGKVADKESDVLWCLDDLKLSCDNGGKVRVAFVLDCCDREIMSWVAIRDQRNRRGFAGRFDDVGSKEKVRPQRNIVQAH